MAELLPLAPHDHPEPRTLVWSETELRAIRQYAARCVDAAVAALTTTVEEQRRTIEAQMWPEVTVTMPMALTPEMLRAVRDHETTRVDSQEWYGRLGWLLCAWDVLVEHRLKPPTEGAKCQPL